MDAPSLILGRALAAWNCAPDWRGVNPDCSRERAEQAFADYLDAACASWNLAIVPRGVLEEIEKDYAE